MIGEQPSAGARRLAAGRTGSQLASVGGCRGRDSCAAGKHVAERDTARCGQSAASVAGDRHRLRRPGRWPRLLAGDQAQQLTTDPLNPIVLAAERDAPRGTIYDANGNVLARNAGRRHPPARVPLSCRCARCRLPQQCLRHRRPGTNVRRAADRADLAPRRRRPAAQVPRPSVRPGRPVHVARHRPPAGRRRPARRSARRGRRDRAGHRTRACPGQQPELQPQPHRRSGDRSALRGRAPGSDRLAAAQPGHAGPVRARLGVQDRDRDGRPWQQLNHAPDDVYGSTGRVRHRLPGRWLSRARLPTPCADRSSARLLRSNRGFKQHLVCPRRPGYRRPEPGWLGGAPRLRRTAAVRPAHVTKPGDRRRRTV